MTNTKFGSWEINVATGVLPQKVATAFGELDLLGAEYTPIAYLGSQVVNGTNHAVLAEQLLINGKDTKNIVLMIFNERGMDCNLANIERIVESGSPLGGTQVDVKLEIPADAQKAFDNVLGNFVGAGLKPFALLATQVVKGINYVFAVEITTVAAEPEKKVAIVTVNELMNKASFADVLHSEVEVSLGKPLGEWP